LFQSKLKGGIKQRMYAHLSKAENMAIDSEYDSLVTNHIYNLIAFTK